MKSRGRKEHTVEIRRHTGGVESFRGYGQGPTKVNHAGDGSAVDDLQTVGVVFGNVEFEVDLAFGGTGYPELVWPCQLHVRRIHAILSCLLPT